MPFQVHAPKFSGFDADGTIDHGDLDIDTAFANSSCQGRRRSRDACHNGRDGSTRLPFKLEEEATTASTSTFSNDGRSSAVVVDRPASTTTSRRHGHPGYEAPPPLWLDPYAAAGCQTDISPAAVGDGTIVALDAAISYADSDPTTSATVGEHHCRRSERHRRRLGIKLVDGADPRRCSASGVPSGAGVSRILHRRRRGRGRRSGPPWPRRALWRPGTLTIFEGQTAMMTIIMIVRVLHRRISSSRTMHHAGVLIAN